MPDDQTRDGTVREERSVERFGKAAPQAGHLGEMRRMPESLAAEAG